jgi:hypothetical protein
MSARAFAVATTFAALGLAGCGTGISASPRARTAIPPGPVDPLQATSAMRGTVRVGYLHHSTGGAVWDGGLPASLEAWNAAHGTDYRITSVRYPDTRLNGPSSYPWENYPYDYWNLWVAHRGASRDRNEQNLDDLAAAYDVIVWKHCYPVADLGPDDGAASVSSPSKTLANYRLQYAALKARMHEYPNKRFLVWTGPALTVSQTNPASAQRARDFAAWVKETWDEPGDNIYLWDFREIETGGGLYLPDGLAAGPDDPHPGPSLSRTAGPLAARRIVDVIEGRGDAGSLTGR